MRIFGGVVSRVVLAGLGFICIIASADEPPLEELLDKWPGWRGALGYEVGYEYDLGYWKAENLIIKDEQSTAPVTLKVGRTTVRFSLVSFGSYDDNYHGIAFYTPDSQINTGDTEMEEDVEIQELFVSRNDERGASGNLKLWKAFRAKLESMYPDPGPDGLMDNLSYPRKIKIDGKNVYYSIYDFTHVGTSISERAWGVFLSPNLDPKEDQIQSHSLTQNRKEIGRYRGRWVHPNPKNAFFKEIIIPWDEPMDGITVVGRARAFPEGKLKGDFRKIKFEQWPEASLHLRYHHTQRDAVTGYFGASLVTLDYEGKPGGERLETQISEVVSAQNNGLPVLFRGNIDLKPVGPDKLEITLSYKPYFEHREVLHRKEPKKIAKSCAKKLVRRKK